MRSQNLSAVTRPARVSGGSGWAFLRLQAAYMASHGMTFITPLLAMALLIEVVGSVCVLLGFRARAAAAVMFVYLGIVSVRLHDFWNLSGMAAAGTQTQFFKNLGMMGGLLMVAVYGAGAWSLDARSSRAVTAS